MTEETQTGIPDEAVDGEVQLYKAQHWSILSKVKKADGWTIVAVSPDDPKAPGNAPAHQPGAAIGGGGGPSPAPGTGGGGGAAAGTSNDTLTLARTIYGEARGEPAQGQEAVANVVVNRKNRAGKYPNTIAGVCLQHMQFSCWNANDPNSKVITNLQPGANAKFDACLQIAQQAVAGTLGDHTGGATHYYADSIAAPNWAAPPAVTTVQIGRRRFFRNVA